MKLESRRLQYNPVTPDSFGFFSSFLSHPELTRYLPPGEPYSLAAIEGYLGERVAHWAGHRFGTYIVREKDQHQIIGYCGLEYVRNTGYIEIRYGIIPEKWGMGFACEAADVVLADGFSNPELTEIYGAAVAENRASVKVLRKIGMEKCSTVDFHGDSVDYYCISKEQYGNNCLLQNFGKTC